MKSFILIIALLYSTTSLFAQTVKYVEQFSKNEQRYYWRTNQNREVKDEAYQVTSSEKGKVYERIPFSSSFSFKYGQDWIFEISMKAVKSNKTSQWGVELQSEENNRRVAFWMDRDELYGDLGHMPCKMKKGFNKLKVIKTGDTLKVFVNDNFLGSSILKLWDGEFVFSQSEASNSGPLVIQYDDISLEVPRPKELQKTAPTCDQNSTFYLNEEYGFSLCLDKSGTATQVHRDFGFAKDFVSIKGFLDLPLTVFPLQFDTVASSLKYERYCELFEDKYFAAVGEIKSKELHNSIRSTSGRGDKTETYERTYDVILTSGNKAIFSFTYLITGNDKLKSLCFQYMAPAEGMIGAAYALRSSALMLECKVLEFK